MASEQYQKLVHENFSKVIELVEEGTTICKALDKLNLNRTIFYKVITPKQKAELQMAKTANAEFGNISHYR